MIVPKHISNYRRELCLNCPTPCGNQKNESFHKESDSSCPISRFGVFVTAQPQRKISGLGDVVAVFAKPVAKIADGLLKTKFVGCKACASRQQKLNDLLPF